MDLYVPNATRGCEASALCEAGLSRPPDGDVPQPGGRGMTVVDAARIE